MPAAQTLAGMLVVLTLSVGEQPRPVLYTATVKDAEAEVRSGPSTDPKLYPTNRLRQGSVVEVVEEKEGGWLAIKSPPGSFSWIQMRFLEPSRYNQWTWTVITHDDVPVPVRIGSDAVNEKPSVVGARIKRGSQVVAVGKPMTTPDDGEWLPIEPPPGELRYLRAQSVVRTAAPAQVAALSPPPPAPGYGNPPPPPVPMATAAGGNFARPASLTSATPSPLGTVASSDPTWLQAQQLEQAGRYGEAEQKYRELADRVRNENHDLAMQCYNRIYFLREAQHGAAQPGAHPAQAIETRYPDSRLQPVANNPYCPPAASPCNPASYPPPSQQSNYNPAPPAQRTTNPGRLELAGRVLEGRRTYILINGRGYIESYVTAAPGTNLDSYLGRTIQVTGPLVYRMDIRNMYVEAQQVTPLP